jgi:hypothetical protein
MLGHDVSTQLRNDRSEPSRARRLRRLHPKGPSSGTIAVAVAIATAPVVLVAALRLPLINQLDYADAWFYSAYGWVPKHHFRIFDWNYFSVRFPPILAIAGSDHLFGAAAGYIVLRYVLAVIAGTALFLGVERFSNRDVALATTLMLYANPFFSRMLLWDYAGFLAIAAAVTGVGLWYWSDDRRLLLTLPAAIALAVAVFANALLVTAVFVLLCVEALAAVRSGRAAASRFVARLAVSAFALVAVFVAGYLAYSAALGSLSPDDLLRPTIKFLRENNKNAGPYQHPVGSWLLHEPRIWAPVLLSLALVAVLRGRLFQVDLLARAAQFCIGYTAFFWVYRFAVTSSGVETWWAYNFVVVATAFGIGVLLHEVARHQGPQRVAVWAVVATVVTALLIRDVGNGPDRAYHYVSTHVAVFLALLVVGALTAGLVAVSWRWVSGGALIAFLSVGVVMFYAPSVLDGRGATGIFVPNGDLEWRGYVAGKEFIEVVRDHDRPDSRVYLWYSGALGLTSVAWTDLPQYGQTLQVLGAKDSLHQLTDLGRARLANPAAAFVMTLSTRSGDLVAGRRALTASGYRTRIVRRGALANGSLQFSLLQILTKP